MKNIEEKKTGSFLRFVESLPSADGLAFGAIDWVTLTYIDAENYLVEDLIRYYLELQLKKGVHQRPTKNRVMTGFQSGEMVYGHLNGHSNRNIISIWGERSQMLASWVSREIKTTRIDLAVDVFFPKVDTGCRDALEDFYTCVNGDRQHLDKATRISSPHGGYTLYYGKRTDKMMLRVYDKGSQMARKPNMWFRYELQINREYAHRARMAMLDSYNVTEWIKGVVVKFCQDRYLPCDCIGGDETQWIAATVLTGDSDDLEQKKAWFNSVVVPFVQRFVVRVGEEYVVDKLGLGTYLSYMDSLGK